MKLLCSLILFLCSAVISFSQDFKDECKAIHERYMSLNPDSVNMEIELVYADSVINCDPENEKGLIFKGQVYVYYEEDSKAYDCFTKVIRKNSSPVGYFNRAKLYLRNDQFYLWLADMKQAVANSKTISDEIFYTIEISDLLFDYRRPTDGLSILLSLYWKHKDYTGDRIGALYAELGRGYADVAKMDSSFYFFRKALKYEPENHVIWNNIGYEYSKMGVLDSAIYYLETSLALDTTLDVIYNNLGYCYLMEGNLDQAFSMVSKSIEMNPYNSMAFKNMALYYIEVEDFVNACSYLDQADSLNYTQNYGSEVGSLKQIYCSP